MTEPSIWHEVQTKLVKLSAKPIFLAIKWAAAADGLEANDADGEAFAFTTVKA